MAHCIDSNICRSENESGKDNNRPACVGSLQRSLVKSRVHAALKLATGISFVEAIQLCRISQYSHVIDFLPKALDLVGIKAPDELSPQIAVAVAMEEAARSLTLPPGFIHAALTRI